jgi:hypothetical protein
MSEQEEAARKLAEEIAGHMVGAVMYAFKLSLRDGFDGHETLISGIALAQAVISPALTAALQKGREQMREEAAMWHETHARAHASSRPGRPTHAQTFHEESAVALRALPLSPGSAGEAGK